MENNLLEWYMKGFHDELWGTSTIISEDQKENVAYNLGSSHAMIGDDVRSVDYLSNEEILLMIENNCKK